MILSPFSKVRRTLGQHTYIISPVLRRALLTLVVLGSVNSYAQTSLVDENYSLKADREAFEELRKNIPEGQKKENDEKAFMDQLVSDLTRPPAEVRNKFQSIVTKKRNLFSKDMTKAREDFSKKQKDERSDFTDKQKNSREDFAKKKVDSKERSAFYDKLEAARKDFYTDQREKSDEFNEDIRERRKNFDDYMRARTDEFNEVHRDYTKRFEENKKFLADSKKQAELKRQQMQKDLDKQYEPIRNQTPIQLQPAEPEGN